MDQKKLDYSKIEKSARVKKNLLNTVIYTFLGLWAVMVLFPFGNFGLL